jgi:methionyl-tRNA formyltransferase
MKELRVVFMGTPDFAVSVLEYLVTGDYQIVGVYTGQDKAAGRGQLLAVSPVKKAAAEFNLPVIQPRTLKSPEAVAELAALHPDLIAVAAFGQILSRQVLDMPRFGCLNIHPSLLPRYRGVSPIPAAIMAGDEFTGVSIMLLDAGTDTGPVLSQAQVPVLPADTTGSLTDKLSLIGAQLLVDAIPRWTSGRLRPRPQDNARATYCRKLTKEEGLIDWHLPAAVLERRIRALSPWPGAFTTWQGKQLKILSAKPAVADEAGETGAVVALKNKEVGVVTGDGVLVINSLQSEGKKAMTAAEFVRGQRGLIGAVLPGR